MKGFATSPNPYMTGVKPRQFFSARVQMLKREQMLKKTAKNTGTASAKKTDRIKMI